MAFSCHELAARYKNGGVILALKEAVHVFIIEEFDLGGVVLESPDTDRFIRQPVFNNAFSERIPVSKSGW